MPKRSNAFQQLVFLINSSLSGSSLVTESGFLIDRVTGEEREVDILIRAQAADYDVTIGIEVNARGRKADTPWIEEMHAKHEHLPTDKLVLVSESGFYKPALSKARFLGIEAVTIGSALQTDWDVVAKLTSTGFFELIEFSYSCCVVGEAPNGERSQFQVATSATIATGSEAIPLDSFVKQVLARSEVKDVLLPRIISNNERDFWFSYSPPETLNIDWSERALRIVELRVGLKADLTRTPIQYAAGTFKGIPFVSGTSTAEKKLQFVIVKQKNGACQGIFLDDNGLRRLMAE